MRAGDVQPPGTLLYVDRESGELRRERVHGGRSLHTLYRTRRGALLRPLLAGTPLFSAVSAGPRKRFKRQRYVEDFVREHGIDANEAERPLSAYRDFDEFFTRRLKSSARPVDADPSRLVAPVDGRLRVYRADSKAVVTLKGQRVALGEVLGEAFDASALEGGRTVLVLRLAPMDYHRIHHPADGRKSAPSRLGRRLHSVHPIASEAGAPGLTNKRAITRLDTEAFGPILQVDIGALTVGTIVHSFMPGWVRRGEEHGHFRFGGSTVLLAWGPDGPVVDADLIDNGANGLETFVKMGSAIADAR